MKNRRHEDMFVAMFDGERKRQGGGDIDRTGWGLPIPNKAAAYISLAKYAKSSPVMGQRETVAMNVAFQWMERQFGTHMCNSKVKELEEVLKGMDRSTSTGSPWNKRFKTKGDMYVVKEDGNIEYKWQEMPAYMEEDWDRLMEETYTAIFGNSLKEEVRATEKIAANSLRTFTAGPVEMTAHGNRLFEDMNDKFYASHLQTASVVGFTPLKGGWNNLIEKLRCHPNGFALDESQYDSSLWAFLMWGVAEFRWNMLRQDDRTEENRQRIRVYYRNLVNTLIITSEGVLVMKQTGNPSGSVNTIVDNTLILYVLLAFGWLMTAPDVRASYEAFEEDVSLALCGDDNTWTVSDGGVRFFNARVLIEVWKGIGIVTTTDCLDPRPVEELDFLSAFTIYDEQSGKALPLYNSRKLLTSLRYSRQPDNPSMTLTRACALLRVSWADVRMRGYLRELIQYLVVVMDPVLRNDPEWRMAKNQIPTESHLRNLFVGEVPLCLQNQGLSGDLERNNSQIKRTTYWESMEVIALPQRQKRRRQRKRGAAGGQAPRRAFIGPMTQGGSFRSRRMPQGFGRLPRAAKRQGRRRRRGGKGGGTNATRATGAFSARGMPRGIRGGKRFPFDEDEFIVDLLGSTTFGNGANLTAQQFSINPGQAIPFPWLSAIAPKFEKYVFTRLEFYYKHEVSQYAAAGTIGKAILSFDYDASDAPPTGKQQMLDTDPHADGMPCEDFVLRVDCRTAFDNGPKYVRPGNLPGGSDIKTFDIGLLNYGAAGTNDGTTKIGELHVRYAGWFEKPVLESSRSAPANNQVSLFQAVTPGQICVYATPTILTMATVVVNGLNIVNTSGSFQPPPGNYLVDGTIICYDSVEENFGAIIDVQSGGVSLYTYSGAQPTVNVGEAGSAAIVLCLPIVQYYTSVVAGVLSPLTVVATLNGATGVLKADATLRFTAV